jgi:hypothetical protein
MYYHNVTPIYSQTCIKRSSLDKKIEWPLKKGDLLKKAKFLDTLNGCHLLETIIQSNLPIQSPVLKGHIFLVLS